MYTYIGMDTKQSKSETISHWKSRGVKYDDFDELYYVYVKTLNCSHCGKEFKNSRDRHLDHDHKTGLFRTIICCKCNIHDSYINYPDGYDRKEWQRQWSKNNYKKKKRKILQYKKEYYKQNKQRINEQKYKKYDCGCGGKYMPSSKANHFETFKHMDWFMEQVD